MSEKASTYRGYTEAQKRASEKYIEKNDLVETKFRTSRKDKEEFQEHAKNMGESTNAFIIRAIKNTMQTDRDTTSGAD